MKLSRRHHYLPKMYLRGFADESERVWVYNRQNNSYIHQGVMNTAVKRDFYTIRDPDGQKSDEIEKVIADIESWTKPIIERFDTGDLTVGGDDRAVVSLFVVLLMTRTPAFDTSYRSYEEQAGRWRMKNMTSTVAAAEEMLRGFEKATGIDMSDVTAQEMYESIRDDNYEVEIPRQNSIKAMMELALDGAEAVRRMNWGVTAAPKGTAYITCDSPVTVVPPSFLGNSQKYGMLTPGAWTFVPLSGKTMLHFRDFGGCTLAIPGSRDFVRHVNLMVAANSEQFAIARDEPLLRSLVRRGGLNLWQQEPRLKFTAPQAQ